MVFLNTFSLNMVVLYVAVAMLYGRVAWVSDGVLNRRFGYKALTMDTINSRWIVGYGRYYSMLPDRGSKWLSRLYTSHVLLIRGHNSRFIQRYATLTLGACACLRCRCHPLGARRSVGAHRTHSIPQQLDRWVVLI